MTAALKPPVDREEDIEVLRFRTLRDRRRARRERPGAPLGRAKRPERRRPLRRVTSGVLPAHTRLLADTTSPYLGFVGGWGAGKTHGAALKAIQLALANSPEAILVVAPSYKHLEDAILVEIRKLLRHWGAWRRAKYNKHDHKLTFWLSGKECNLWLRHARDPDSIAGPSVAAALIDEAGLIKDEIFDVVDSRVRLRGAAQLQLVATGTGDQGKSGWFWRIFEGAPLEGANLVRAPTWENVCLPDDYVRRRLGHLDPLLYQRYAAGEFVDLSGRVYSHFDEARHVAVPQSLEEGDLAICADFGFDVMAWALVLLRKERRAGKVVEVLHIVDELVREDLTTHQMAQECVTWLAAILRRATGLRWSAREAAAEVTVYCDPAGGDEMSKKTQMSDVALLKAAGFKVKHRLRHPPIRDRVNAVQTLLWEDRLLVDETRAPYFAKCLREQRWGKDGKPEKGRPRDKTKGLDHGADAIGYIAEYRHPCAVSERRVLRYH